MDQPVIADLGRYEDPSTQDDGIEGMEVSQEQATQGGEDDVDAALAAELELWYDNEDEEQKEQQEQDEGPSQAEASSHRDDPASQSTAHKRAGEWDDDDADYYRDDYQEEYQETRSRELQQEEQQQEQEEAGPAQAAAEIMR